MLQEPCWDATPVWLLNDNLGILTEAAEGKLDKQHEVPVLLPNSPVKGFYSLLGTPEV